MNQIDGGLWADENLTFLMSFKNKMILKDSISFFKKVFLVKGTTIH